MRRGEILGLMWDDIDFDDRVISVMHNKAFDNRNNDAKVSSLLKTTASRRRIPMNTLLFQALMSLRQEDDGSPYVIHSDTGESLTKAQFRWLWEKVDRATEKMGFRCHPHQLRHTFCTQCIESDMDVKEVQNLMGHAKADVTMNIYTHYRQKSREFETSEKLRNAMSFLEQS